MADDYFVGVNESLSLFDFVDNEQGDVFSDMSDFVDSRSSVDYYDFYGVDNDFDLAEAMFFNFERSTGNLVRTPWFVDFRIKCGLNPEYTEKCLKSEAFQDVKDEILKRLSVS